MRSHLNLRHPLDFKSLIPQWVRTWVFGRLCPQSDRTCIKVWYFQLDLNSRTQRGQWLWNGSQCQFPTLPEARSSRINLGIKISVNVKTNKSWRASTLQLQLVLVYYCHCQPRPHFAWSVLWFSLQAQSHNHPDGDHSYLVYRNTN